MRIGISTSVIQRGKTGVAQYVFALLKALQHYSDQNQFTLFVLEEDLPLFQFASAGMEIVSVPEQFRPAVKNIIWHQTHLPKLIRERKIDVLHVPSYRRMLWPKPCALVSTIHDLAPFHVSGKYDWKRMFYGRVLVKRLASRQDRIIAISQNTARDIERFFKVPRSRISVIHNGLNHQNFFPASQEKAKKEFAQKHGITFPFFLYLARLEHPGKNHVRLIDAFNRFKTETKSNWHLVFCGSDWHGAEIVHQAIKASPFAAQIQSLGFMPDAELPGLYRAADAFIYPSLYEGFGMPPTEAMACGCPVISSDRGSLSEVVGDAALIVNPENISELKQRMVQIVGDAGLRGQLSMAGIARAKLFHWEKAASETITVYHQAFEERTG